MKGDKSGQFYLIAAIIIVALMITLVSLVNYVSKRNEGNLEEIGEGLKIESEKVLDYDKKNGASKFDNFTREFSSYLGDVNASYIVVDSSSSEAYYYDSGLKEDLGSSLVVTSTDITLTLDETDYRFDRTSGTNFYFVLTHEVGNEKYVFSN